MDEDRGELITYCPAHDYGDPGYPPIECSSCEFSGDVLIEQARIDAAIATEHDQIRLEIEKMYIPDPDRDSAGGYNVALDDVIRLIGERTKK
jgi:hypothetical protein